MTYKELEELIISRGAFKAEKILTEDIVLSTEFLDMCKMNSCGKYGKCYMCPPEVGDIEDLMERLRTFKGGVLFQTVSELEDSFDIEGMHEASVAHNNLTYGIQDYVRGEFDADALVLSKGGCGLCEVCAKATDEPCRFPGKAIASLESHGVDVYKTTLATSLKYINGQNTVTYFALVLSNKLAD